MPLQGQNPGCIVTVWDMPGSSLLERMKASPNAHDLQGMNKNCYYYTVHLPQADDESDNDDEETDTDTRPRRQRRNKKQKTGVQIDKTPFIAKWMADEEMKTYDYMDCNPAGVAEGVYNSWRGFAVERFPPATDADREVMKTRLRPFIRDVICSGQEDAFKYLENHNAHMYQKPSESTRTAMVLLGKEGTGKNTFLDMHKEMAGQNLVLQVSTLTDCVFGRFADPAEGGRILLIMDEIEPQEIKKYYRTLMDAITNDTATFEKKNVQGIWTVRNLIRQYFTTNDAEKFIPVRAEDRKYAFIEVADTLMGQSTQFFGPFRRDVIKCKGVMRAYFDHLTTLDITDVNFETSRPYSKMYEDSKLSSVPLELRFILQHLLDDPDQYRRGEPISTSDLWAGFRAFVAQHASGKCSDYSATDQRLGIFISKVPGFEKSTHHGPHSQWKRKVEPLAQYLFEKNLITDKQVTWLTKARHYEQFPVYEDCSAHLQHQEQVEKLTHLSVQQTETTASLKRAQQNLAERASSMQIEVQGE